MEGPGPKKPVAQSVSELNGIISKTKTHKLLQLLGVITVPLIFGYFILKNSNAKLRDLESKKNRIVVELESSIKKLSAEVDRPHSKIVKSNTYLIYSDKDSALKRLENHLKDLKFLISNSNLFTPNFNSKVTEVHNKVINNKKQISEYNQRFVEKRKVEHEYLFDKSSAALDDNQKTAIITDDKHNLVVAGAGSGKTEVLITRIAYLIERKPDTVKRERILALAFQNKAAKEIKERLKHRYGVDVKIKTFHALGKEILENGYKIKGMSSPKLMFSGDNFEIEFQKFIGSIFDKLKKDRKFQNDITNYMKMYGDDEIVKTVADFDKKADYYEYMRNLTYGTFDGTQVKSEGEREVMNFFITHNLNGKKIKILYEHPTEWMKYTKGGKEYIPTPDFYLPDHDIYIEHWALNNNSKVPDWFGGSNPTEEYKKIMDLKKKKFEEQDKYILVETTYGESKDADFIDVLRGRVISALKTKYPDEEFSFTPLSYHDLVNKVWAECKESVEGLPRNISSFIVIAKTYNQSPEDIEKRMKSEPWSLKQHAFSKIAIKIFNLYENELKESNKIDFADMINLAIRELQYSDELYEGVFDHILIDEYQDISNQRYELINELMQKNDDCKLFCVGDDWQSIMGFTGSDLDFFVNFSDYFENPVRTDLSVNYRSIKSIVDTGAEIIKHNGDSQLKKKVKAKNQTQREVTVYSSLIDSKKQYYEDMARHCVDKIHELHEEGCEYDDMMILSRITVNPMMINPLLDYAKERNVPILKTRHRPKTVPLTSVHKSKGLQAENVFILNVDKDLYGFPCLLENPDIFEPVRLGRRKDKEEEERRLFYVAVTRAKQNVFIYNQRCAESKFLKEIENHTKLKLLGKVNSILAKSYGRCPYCNGPIYTNKSEISKGLNGGGIRSA